MKEWRVVSDKENVYEKLIQDYKDSIHSLKMRLAQTRDGSETNKLTIQIQAYEEQLSKLKEVM